MGVNCRPNSRTTTQLVQGRIQEFFRRGCTRLLLYFNINKPHSFFFCRIPVVLENRRSSRGGAHPLHPPPRSAPVVLRLRCFGKHVIDRVAFPLRRCLHGGGVLQVGEVTCGGSPHLSCERDHIKMRDYTDRRVTTP